jgi:hypothetical protein
LIDKNYTSLEEVKNCISLKEAKNFTPRRIQLQGVHVERRHNKKYAGTESSKNSGGIILC